VTTAQAARAAEVSAALIRKWVAREHLHPIARDCRSNVFRLADVLRARDGAAARNRQPKSLHTSDDWNFRSPLPDRFRGVTSANLQDLVTTQEGAKSAGVPRPPCAPGSIEDDSCPLDARVESPSSSVWMSCAWLDVSRIGPGVAHRSSSKTLARGGSNATSLGEAMP